MALRQVGWSVAGWDPSIEALKVAASRGAVDETCSSIGSAVEGAELVVLAAPLNAAIETLAGLDTDALVTDVAGVKLPIVAARPPNIRLVAGHPMAGREHAGPTAATPALFRGAVWILCPDDAADEDVSAIAGIVESVGGTPVMMSAEEHDRAVAKISHLPQIIATSLVNQVSADHEALQLVSGSFRDLTRVAASDPSWWPEVLAANEPRVGEAIDELIAQLNSLKDLIGTDLNEVRNRLSAASRQRRSMAPPVVRVGVVLQDKPGEIAAVGRALEQSSVDVRDLQLRHALHGGGGVLTLSVRPGEAEPLRTALAAEGFSFE